MARAANKSAQVRPVDDEGCLVLRGELFWRWRALDAELRNTELLLAAKQRTIDEEIAKSEILRTLIADRHGLVRLHAQHKTEMKDVHHRMRDTLGVDVNDISIDDKTGRVHILNGTPIKPAPRKTATKKVRTK